MNLFARTVPSASAFPEDRTGRLLHYSFRGLLGVHSRYGLHARQVAIATLYTEGFSGFVASTAAPIVTGWSEPVPGRDFHPLWTSAFSRRTFLANFQFEEPSTMLTSARAKAAHVSQVIGLQRQTRVPVCFIPFINPFPPQQLAKVSRHALTSLRSLCRSSRYGLGVYCLNSGPADGSFGYEDSDGCP